MITFKLYTYGEVKIETTNPISQKDGFYDKTETVFLSNLLKIFHNFYNKLKKHECL